MLPKDASRPVQAGRVLMLGVLAVLMAVLAACGGAEPATPPTSPPASASSSAEPAGNATSSPRTPPPTNPPGSASDPYGQFDQDVARLLTRRAAWQAPKRINVDQTARVGLVIGDPSLLKAQIRQLVPGTYPKPAGTVKVGSTISVKLLADPRDASVTPSGAVDESMGEHTALLWTWYVNAKHPNASLLLTAEIVTKMSDGHVLYKQLALPIFVDRTVKYTLYQVFSNWATWAAIVAALGGTASWIWRKRRKRPDTRKGEKSENKEHKHPRDQS